MVATIVSHTAPRRISTTSARYRYKPRRLIEAIIIYCSGTRAGIIVSGLFPGSVSIAVIIAVPILGALGLEFGEHGTKDVSSRVKQASQRNLGLSRAGSIRLDHHQGSYGLARDQGRV